MKKRNLCLTAISLFLAAVCLLTTVPSDAASADPDSSASASSDTVSADSSSAVTFVPVGKYGMLPIYGRDVRDGVYPIAAESSSTMFRIVDAELQVKDGEMQAVITLSGQGYSRLFMGTAKEAQNASETSFLPFEEDDKGMYSYTIPVEALDKKLDCAAYSKRKEMWYDRVILFDASSLPAEALLLELPDYHRIEEALTLLENQTISQDSDPEEETETPVTETEDLTEMATITETAAEAEALSLDMEDGEYSIAVDLAGGSGKAAILSPTCLIVEKNRAYARIQWSSSNYDYMIVGTQKYLNENMEGGNSSFTIPITVMDREMPVIADTTAMGTPHEVEYSLTFYSETIGSKSQMPQEAAKRVVVIALLIIVGGGILNHIVKKKRAC